MEKTNENRDKTEKKMVKNQNEKKLKKGEEKCGNPGHFDLSTPVLLIYHQLKVGVVANNVSYQLIEHGMNLHRAHLFSYLL